MTPEPLVPPPALAAIRAPFLERGAEVVQPLVLMPLNVLLDLMGEAMRARLFVVQGEGGEELCLRPDFTVPVTRGHVEAGHAEGRYLYEGRAFRVAAPGRPQEFLQIGIEALGETSSPDADAEVVAAAWRAAAAGGRRDLSLTLGDVGLFEAFATALEVPPVLRARLRRAMANPAALELAFERSLAPEAARPSPLAALLAGRPEAEATALIEDLWGMMSAAPVGGRSAAEVAHRLVERAAAAETPVFNPANAGLLRRYLAIADQPAAALDAVAALAGEAGLELHAPLDAWARRLAALETAGVPSPGQRFATAFGRAFDYYDGFLFEVRSAALGSEQPVAAGGRYDGLPARLGGRAVGAVGCMVRPARAWSGA